MKTRKIVTISILTSISIVLSIIESFIPSFIPGTKIGLANVVTLIILYMYSYKEAFACLLIRIFIVGLLYSGIFSIAFILSLAGGLLSFIFILIVNKLSKDLYLTSLIGSVFHQIGQIIALIILIKSIDVIYYLPIMIVVSILTGLITASIAHIVLKSFKFKINKIKFAPILAFAFIFIISLVITIYFNVHNERSNKYATITYRGNELIKLDVTNPKTLTNDKLNDILINSYKEDDSYYYILNVYNNDDNECHQMIIEITNNEIRIKDSACQKRICSHQGFINNKYERIICVPNEVIISIHTNENNEIDFIM